MLKRTHTCGDLRTEHSGETVVLAGWVNTYRDHSKGLVFIDLRDRNGLTQVVFDLEDVPAEVVDLAQGLRREYVIAVKGTVRPRDGGSNPKLATGEIEMIDKGGYYNISPNIAVKATPEETVDSVFGSDLLGNGAVIKKTFTDADFSYDEAKNTLVIDSTYIITDLSHVTGDYEVWFLIRNDKTRKSVPGWPGIRVLAAYEKRCNKNVKRVS